MILKNNNKLALLSFISKNRIFHLILNVVLCTEIYTSTYTASTVVGIGTYNAATLEADGTRWNAVKLGVPNSVIKDPTDNSIIVADTNHLAIRRVDASGTVSTVLSGFGANPPKFLTIDPLTGDIYGTNGVSIFKILKNYTTVYILATSLGTAPSSLGTRTSITTNCLTSIQAPDAGIAYDYEGKYLYFSNTSGQIWQMNMSATPYTLLAVTSGFSSAASGLTLNKTLNKLYMINNASSIYKIYQISVPATIPTAIGSLTSIAGGSGSSWVSQLGSLPLSATAVLLPAPKQLAIDSAENVYVTDSNYIGKISGGNISLFAGNSSSATLNTNFTSVNGIFIDEGNAIFTSLGTSSNSYNLIKRIIQQGTSIILASGKTITATTLNVPYYSTINFNGGGEISVSSSNAGMSYGQVSLSASTITLGAFNALGSGGSDNQLTLTNSTLRIASSLSSATVPQSITSAGTSRINANKNLITLSNTLKSTNSWTNNLVFEGGGIVILISDNSSTLKGGVTITDPGTVLVISDNNQLGWGIGQNNIFLQKYGTLKINADITFPRLLKYQDTVSLDTSGHAITLSGGLDPSYSTDILYVKGGGTVAFTQAADASSSTAHGLKIAERTTITLNPTGVNRYVNLNISVVDGSAFKISKSGLTIASFSAS